MKLCVEDLPRTCLLNCSFEALTFLNSVPDSYLCFDTNHLLMQTNEDFLNDLIDNGMTGRIAAVHISDYDFIDERHKLPGAGINDWKMILSKLEALDYSGAFVYEDCRQILRGLRHGDSVQSGYRGRLSAHSRGHLRKSQNADGALICGHFGQNHPLGPCKTGGRHFLRRVV